MAIAVAALAWFLPWVYALAFPTSDSQPFMSFSPVNDKWIISRASANSKPTIQIVDSILPDGTMLTTDITREERDSLERQSRTGMSRGNSSYHRRCISQKKKTQ